MASNQASHTKTATTKPLLSTYNLVLTAMFAAILAVISQISIPMPTGVPVTIQAFGIALTGAVLGWKLGTLSTIVYILLGAVGLPIFANFMGGIQVLAGMTGGYIWGWPFMAALCGLRFHTGNSKTDLILSIVMSLMGLLIMEFTGGLQWYLLSGEMTMNAIIIYSFTAFIPKDMVITVAAVIVGRRINHLLGRHLGQLL